MSILVSGSLAYDHIMNFHDRFKDHILPEQIHILSVSFVVNNLKKEFGGCAGNIGYTIKLLGGNPHIFSTLGLDAGTYIDHLKKYNIQTDHILVSENCLTAAAHITTDRDNNQITAFYPGPLAEATKLSIEGAGELSLAILAPTDNSVMVHFANQCAEKNIPIVFDPGQHLTTFTSDELRHLIRQSTFLIANDYEMKLITDRTGCELPGLLEHVQSVIITLGEKGSKIITRNEQFEIAPCPVTSIEDPTGAGDAYRAGFFTAYTKGQDLKTCGQVGSVAASYAIEKYGTQKHVFTPAEFEERYYQTYREPFSLLVSQQELVTSGRTIV